MENPGHSAEKIGEEYQLSLIFTGKIVSPRGSD